jgi:hypothetical protein
VCCWLLVHSGPLLQTHVNNNRLHTLQASMSSRAAAPAAASCRFLPVPVLQFICSDITYRFVGTLLFYRFIGTFIILPIC